MTADAQTYGQMQQDFYNQRAVSEERAEELVHNDYDLATAWAIPSLSAVLLDYAARAGVLPESQTLDSVTECLSRLPSQLTLLDFGCGPGRLMKPLAELQALRCRSAGVEDHRRLRGLGRSILERL